MELREATKIPQTPLTKLEEIICDADLDYLGREDFFEISRSSEIPPPITSTLI